MSTIHSSSLAYYPVGFKYPQTGQPEAKREPAPVAAIEEEPKNRQPHSQRQPSSTAQIQAALAETELTLENLNKPTNLRTLKALTAYTENRNQLAQERLNQTLIGIDIYA